MKYKKLFLLPSLAGIAALTAGIFGVTNSQQVAEVKAASDVSISIADGGWNPFGWGTKSVSNAGLVDTVARNNEANLWNSGFLDMSKHENVDLEFSFDSYDSSSTDIGISGAGLDFMIRNANDYNTIYGGLRVWTDSWGYHNGSHSIQLFGNDWDIHVDKDEDFDVVGGGGHNATISGDASSDKSFNIRLNKSYGLAFKNTWDSWSNCNKSYITSPLITALNNGTPIMITIGGQGGFERETKITLKSYNGQSFANDGVNFTDNIGPEVRPSGSGDMARYTPLGSLQPSSMWDVFGGDCTIVEKHKAMDTPFVNDDEYFPTNGQHYISFKVSDARGNITWQTDEYNVIDPTSNSFAAWLMANHVSEYTCAARYADAKTMFKGLSSDEREAFASRSDEAHTRYINWCAANGDLNPFDGGDPVSSPSIMSMFKTEDNGTTIVTIVTVAISVITLGGLLFIKRRKHA